MPGFDYLYGSNQTGNSPGHPGNQNYNSPPSNGGNNNQNNNQVSPGNPGNTYNPNLNPPVVTPPVNNQNNNTIVDVAAEQDAADDAYATSLFGGNENHPPAIPANEVYGPGSTDPGMGYGFQNISPDLLPKLGLDQMDPKVLESFGYATLNEDGSIFSTKGTSIPNELLKLIMEGSFVSGNEAVEKDEPYTTTFSQFENASEMAKKGNENAKKWLEDNTLFPGGLNEYYDIMDPSKNPNQIAIGQGNSGFYQSDRNLIDDRNAWKERLYYGPKIAPQRAMEQSGFMNTMTNPYLKDMAETLEGGLYGKSIFGMGMNPVGLERKYATGKSRGGIMAIWNDRK